MNESKKSEPSQNEASAITDVSSVQAESQPVSSPLTAYHAEAGTDIGASRRASQASSVPTFTNAVVNYNFTLLSSTFLINKNWIKQKLFVSQGLLECTLNAYWNVC